jgi:hypothetical protein
MTKPRGYPDVPAIGALTILICTHLPLLGAFAGVWPVGAGVVRDLLASAAGGRDRVWACRCVAAFLLPE